MTTLLGHITLDEMDRLKARLRACGIHPDLSTPTETFGLLRAAHAHNLRDLTLDLQGRWGFAKPDPVVYTPADVPAIRACAVSPNLTAVSQRRSYHLLQAVWAIQQAIPYFLDADSALSIMNADLPEQTDVHLPFRSVAVFFSQDLEIPDLAPLLPDDVWDLMPPDAFVLKLREYGTCLSGVVLFASEHGELDDYVVWLCASRPAEEALDRLYPGERIRGFIEGLLPNSVLRPLVMNLAAAVAWGDWKPPEPVDLPSDPDLLRKALRKGSMRRAYKRGDLAQVRVLETRATSHSTSMGGSTENGSAAQIRRSPCAHLRRGHFQRVRVGPRHDWHHEWRWIQPVLVAPHAEGGEAREPSSEVKVYRLPKRTTV